MLMITKDTWYKRLIYFKIVKGSLFNNLPDYKIHQVYISFITFTYFPKKTADYFISCGFQSQFESNKENPDWFNFKLAKNFIDVNKVENEIYSKLRQEFQAEYQTYIEENLRLTKQAKEDRITIDTLRNAIKIVQNHEIISKGEQ